MPDDRVVTSKMTQCIEMFTMRFICYNFCLSVKPNSVKTLMNLYALFINKNSKKFYISFEADPSKFKKNFEHLSFLFDRTKQVLLKPGHKNQ